MSALPVVALTAPIHPEAHARLAEAAEIRVAQDASADALRAVVHDAQGLIVRNHLPDDIFEHAPKLRAVVRHGVGLDMIPVERATARGIVVANLPGSNTAAVVEYCLGAMLHLRRGLAAMDAGLRATGWAPARAMADELAAGPPLVFAAIKEIVREAEAMRFQDAMNKVTKSQFETVERLYRSEDQKEGARAFAEKRDPIWKGK